MAIATFAVAAAAAAVLGAPGHTARRPAAGPVYQPPQSYYLALGDSITYGMQPAKVSAGLPPSRFDTGYVDVVAAFLRKLAPRIRVVNYGCPGESTVTFTRGGCPWLAGGRRLHDAFRGSQLQAALSFLQAHRGRVSPITLTLWGNDLIALSKACKDQLACVRKRAPAAIAAFARRLSSILRRLRATAPTAEIIVTGVWNAEVDQLAQAQPLYRSLDTTIATVAARSRGRFAKTLPVFNPPASVRVEKARICALTFTCLQGDSHPTDAGYRAIARAVEAASGYRR